MCPLQTDTLLTNPNPEQVAPLYYRLFNERRLDDAAQLVDSQVSIRYRPTRQHLIGRAGYRAMADAWLSAFPDAVLEIQSLQVIGGHTAHVKLLGRGTHTGELVLGDAISIPSTGRRAQLTFREVLEIRDGRIVNVELDFDLDDMKRRLLE